MDNEEDPIEQKNKEGEAYELTPEKIAGVKGILEKIVTAGRANEHKFSRQIQDLTIEPGSNGEPYEYWKNRENPELTTIDLIAVKEDDEKEYHLSLNYPLAADGSPDLSNLMLGVESELRVSAFQEAKVAQAGVGPNGIKYIRFRDFLFKDDASEVSVHEHDYTFIHSYRPVGSDPEIMEPGHDVVYQITDSRINEILDLLSQAYIVGSLGEMGDKISDLIPELKNN